MAICPLAAAEGKNLVNMLEILILNNVNKLNGPEKARRKVYSVWSLRALPSLT